MNLFIKIVIFLVAMVFAILFLGYSFFFADNKVLMNTLLYNVLPLILIYFSYKLYKKYRGKTIQ